MIHQQDPVGLITFDEKLRNSLPARSKRTQLANILALLARSEPRGTTEVGRNLQAIAAMIKHRSLLMVFSDLLTDVDELFRALHMLRHAGHDLILFHVLDEAEANFPFGGMLDLKDPESGENLVLDGDGIRSDYLDAVNELCERYQSECASIGADYVRLDTSMPFDKALLEYLSQRRARF
jgi:uncharacterized protein (DUF58 family)